MTEFGCALAAKFSIIKITETITSENNRQQESSKQKKGLHFLGPKMGKHFWTWSKENKYFKFLFIFSFSKKSKKTFPTGAASKNVLTLFLCVPILGWESQLPKALRQAKKQHIIVKFGAWGPIQQFAEFFLSLKNRPTLLWSIGIRDDLLITGI